MRIVFDVTPLSHPRTGVGNYLRGALFGLAEAAAPEDEVVAFALTTSSGRTTIRSAIAGSGADERLPAAPFAHGWRTAWSRLGRPPVDRLAGSFDAFHFSDWWYPPQRGGVRATTVHDLVPLRFPEWTTARTRSMHAAKYRNAAASCDVVFANSEFTKSEVVSLLGVPGERVRVARPGVDPAFTPDGDRAELGQPYALTVATLEPRKNLATLLRAHELVGGELALAVAGGAGWGEQPNLSRPGVLGLGFVDHDALPRVYRGAEVFVFPSRFEGFGMPIVEAMACGTPCVVSSHPSMDEACGDAAVRADPESAEALAAAIEEALGRREELVALGLEHARRFRWADSGRVMLDGYREASR